VGSPVHNHDGADFGGSARLGEVELLAPVDMERSVQLANWPGGVAVDGGGLPFDLVLNKLEKSNPPGRRLAKEGPIGVASCMSSALPCLVLPMGSGVDVVIASMPSISSSPVSPSSSKVLLAII
jgi:hypothetical protein